MRTRRAFSPKAPSSLLAASLLLVFVFLQSSAPLRAAPSLAPQLGPCAPGGVYDPACDVDHDNDVDILDIQLAAGHWNQTGTYTSDNNHNHLGQTWTGSNNPLKLTGSYGTPDWAPLVLSNSTGQGLRISSAATTGVWVGTVGGDGVNVYSAGVDGVYVNSAGYDGVFVSTAGNPSAWASSSLRNGFEVAGAQGYGLYVGRADDDGVRIRSTGDDGIQVGEDGVYPSYGLYVPAPGTTGDTLLPNTADPNGQWALYTVDNIEAGNVFLSAQTLIAVVGGDQPLAPGDVVAAVGLADPLPGGLSRLARVGLASTEQANVAGVVSSRMAQQALPGKDGEQDLRSVDGPAQPGDYVAITVLGAAQVKVDPTAFITAGQRLTVSDSPGQVRALRSKDFDGMLVSEGAPVVGVALEAAKDALVWVLVNPQ